MNAFNHSQVPNNPKLTTIHFTTDHKRIPPSPPTRPHKQRLEPRAQDRSLPKLHRRRRERDLESAGVEEPRVSPPYPPNHHHHHPISSIPPPLTRIQQTLRPLARRRSPRLTRRHMREQHLLRSQNELVRDPGGPDALSRGDCGGCGGDCCWVCGCYCCGGFCAEVY
jgi:hypothetical protein